MPLQRPLLPPDNTIEIAFMYDGLDTVRAGMQLLQFQTWIERCKPPTPLIYVGASFLSPKHGSIHLPITTTHSCRISYPSSYIVQAPADPRPGFTEREIGFQTANTSQLRPGSHVVHACIAEGGCRRRAVPHPVELV